VKIGQEWGQESGEGGRRVRAHNNCGKPKWCSWKSIRRGGGV